MPNIKSAIKRVSVIEKKTLQNNMIKSAYKTAIKTMKIRLILKILILTYIKNKTRFIKRRADVRKP